MRKHTLGLALGAALALPAAPALAQQDFGDIVSGLASTLLNQELDKNAYIEAQNLNTAAAYRSYLKQFPKGAYRANAERALTRLGVSIEPVPEPKPVPGTGTGSGTGTATPASAEAAIGLTRSDRIRIQQQLTAIGYATGVADGLWGRNTRDAITRWQTANKVTATGYLTARQVETIRQQAGATTPGTGSGGTATGDAQLEESLLSLTRSEKREIQRELTLLGYDTRGTDGVFGRNTRTALAGWQADEGEKVTGYITADQLRELRRQTGG